MRAFVMRHRGVLAVVLLLAAVLLAGLYRVSDGLEKHSYNAGATPPQTVHVTSGRQYQISRPGGRTELQQRGISTTAAQCSLIPESGGAVALTVTVISTDVRPTNALGTFVSPVTGNVRIDCGPWGAVYIDDSDNSSFDYAGLFLVLTAICLTLGVALGLSALYARRARDDDEMDRRLGIVRAQPEGDPGDAGH